MARRSTPAAWRCTDGEGVGAAGADDVVGRAGPAGTPCRPADRAPSVRAVAAGTAEAARLSRHGALCSSSAAMPPTCGAAADVPKNGAGKRPGAGDRHAVDRRDVRLQPAVERRPAAAEELRPSDCEVSRHDSSGAAGGKRAGGRRRRRADRADRNHAHRRAAGVALRRDAARRGVVVVALVARRRQQRRPGGGALRLEREEVQVSAAAPRRARSARRSGSDRPRRC